MDDLISKLSEIRSDYNCFDEDEEPYYRALSETIRILSQRADGDTISRQAAIDAFGLSEKTRKYGGDHSGYDTRMLYEIQDTLENLPAVQPDHNADIGKKAEKEDIQTEPHWIPCSERLPEERGFYLTTTKDKAVYRDYWNEDNFDRTEMVIAWMPLPEPYKGGDE